MATLLIKGISEAAKKHLKKQAEENHRSMNQEVIRILERTLPRPIDWASLGLPIKPLRPISHEEMMRTIREAREEREAELDAMVMAVHSPEPKLKGFERTTKGRKKK